MRRLDIRGINRPFTFLLVSNAFKEMRVGETMEILWGDPDSLTDLFKILPTASYERVLSEPIGGQVPGVRMQLKKLNQHQVGMGSPPAANPKTTNHEGGENDRSKRT